ncbi:MAG: peroxiredoxin [Bacteroidia bacterium]
MSAIQDSLQMISDLGAPVIAVTPQMDEYVMKTVRKTKASFTIIPDEGHRIMDKWKVTFTMDAKTQKRYMPYGIRVNVNAGNEDSTLPVPATYIVGTDGRITGSYFDPNYKERMPVKDMLTVLESIQK